MIFQVRKPTNPFLRRYIRSYMLIHVVVDAQSPAPIKAYPATPEEGMSFHIRGHLLAETPELNRLEKRAKTTFFGCSTARQNLIETHEFMLAHIWFMPGALFKLLRLPMAELVHQHIDAELIWGPDIREVNDQLANAPDYDSTFRILDAFFLKKFSQLTDDNRPIDRIGQLIFDNPQGFRLEKIAGQACLSHRQFEKRFIQQIGVSPKFFARISRFYKAYKLKETNPTLDWLSIALEFGYVDAQHLIKDCRQFTNTTPNVFLGESGQSPEFHPGINPASRSSIIY